MGPNASAMTKNSRIAEGRTAEIFAWGDDQILKLYRRGFPSHQADREAARTRAIHAAGLATPAVVDVVEVDGRSGILYERKSGPTMLQEMLAAPEKLAAYARLLAELQADMHARTAAGLPELKSRLKRRIEHASPLSQEMKAAVLAHLDTLPDGNVICHGDFHPENVLMTADGPVIIDWADATQGHPLADVARSSLLMRHGVPLDGSISQQVETARQHVFETYLTRYQEMRPFDSTELAAWKLPVFAARLEEGIAGEEDALLTIMRITLSKKKVLPRPSCSLQ